MSIKSAMDDVEAFHVACGINVRDRPIAIVTEEAFADAQLRSSLINEECNKELLPALEALSWEVDQDEQDRLMVKVADGIADLIYVCIGTALTLGIPLDRVWKEVHRSNMAKVQGGVRRREDGKILKPEGWTPPGVERAIYGPHLSDACKTGDDEHPPTKGVYGWPKVPG